MKIKDVTKVYRTEAGNVEALRGVSLELPERGMVFITGRSGSGKSTLLNVLSGLDSFDGGSIEVCGRELKTLGRAELDTYRNSCCGFVFQEYNLIPELNVRQNVELSLQLQGRKDNGEAVKNALEKVELSGFEERKVYELSGGQKQRVAIARAIVKKPAIIFADEPTGALDEKTGRSILELMKKLSRESLIIAVTHEKEFAEEYGDRIIEIADGEVAQDRIKTEIKCEQGAVKWEKPKMPTGAAVKIGFSNFKFHPLRLAVTVLLASVAFILLGVALNGVFNPSPASGYDTTIDAIRDYSTALSAVFAVFAAALLLNFLFRSIQDKERTVGVLKAAGCSNGGIIKIFICEGFAVGAAVCAVSTLGLTATCLVLEKALYTQFGAGTEYLFGLNFPSFAVMLCGVLAFSLIGCLLPVIKLSRLTPIKCINSI